MIGRKLAHAQKLQLQWSPQQIAGWLAREFGDDESMRVSHETIYKSLFIQARGVLNVLAGSNAFAICGRAAGPPQTHMAPNPTS